jgi:hypothetical protein
MLEPITVFIGYDSREALAYHVCSQSIIERATSPISIRPLHLSLFQDYEETHKDGSNAFIYSRFLVPWQMGFKGWAIFLDGDMIVRDDITKLWAQRDLYKAVQVVKHDYKTQHPIKYLGNKNEDYPRKNWSSVILWNCSHFHNRCLDPIYISRQPGSHLHRFEWLRDEMIGDLPREWNHLCLEYPDNPASKLDHFTLGIPAFSDYDLGGPHESAWWTEYQKALKPL